MVRIGRKTGLVCEESIEVATGLFKTAQRLEGQRDTDGVHRRLHYVRRDDGHRIDLPLRGGLDVNLDKHGRRGRVRRSAVNEMYMKVKPGPFSCHSEAVTTFPRCQAWM